MNEIVVTLWMVMLTGAQVVAGSILLGLRRRWDNLEQRELALDNAERMERLIDLMQRHRGQLTKEIHHAALVLVDAMERDPLAKERHFHAMQQLRTKLAQQ